MTLQNIRDTLEALIPSSDWWWW